MCQYEDKTVPFTLETLFSYFITLFLSKIDEMIDEKEQYQIKETILIVPYMSYHLINSIKNALNSIGLTKIIVQNNNYRLVSMSQEMKENYNQMIMKSTPNNILNKITSPQQ